MNKVRIHRTLYTQSGKKLRRARHLFVFFNRNNITTNQQLMAVANFMRDKGLYVKKKSDKDTRFAILRMLWKIEGGTYGTWHKWLDRKGWNFGEWGHHFLKEESEQDEFAVSF